MCEGSFFFAFSPAFVVTCPVDYSHSNRCEMISHLVLICIRFAMLSIFSYIFWPFICSLGRSICSGSLSMFLLDRFVVVVVVVVIVVESYEVFVYFRY